MSRRLLIIARDYNAARHYANDKKLSPGKWVYISSYHNIQGNAGCDYIRVGDWSLRPDIEVLNTNLKTHKCVEVTHPPSA